MEATTIVRRRRRPFLAPIWLTVLLVVIAAAVALEAYQSAATTTVVVVRSIEDALSRFPSASLEAEGERRAQRLAQLFGGTASPGRVAAIYVAAARRTQQIAAPLAARLGIRPIVLSDEDADQTASRALNEHRGETVMIISNADAVPSLVEALSGIKLAPPAPDEYDDIYIVSVPMVGSAGFTELHY